MFTFYATAPYEMEGVVAGELRDMNFQNVTSEGGRALFSGTYEDALRANLWLRTADRVLLQVGRFEATTFDELFEGVKALPWEEFLPKNASFPVSGKCAKSVLMSVSDAQAITKKAIATRLGAVYHANWLPEDGPTYPIDVHIHANVAYLTIDTSGVALAKRGYRTYNGEAPIRETLAASVLRLSHWYLDQPLCDPMCGSGTIAIEAAMMVCDRAPGLMRDFLMETWPDVDPAWMKRLKEEANERFAAAPGGQIFASDIDPKAVAITKKHVRLAGLDWKLTIKQSPFDKVQNLPDRGAFVMNPPFGVRLMERKEVEKLYHEMGVWFKNYPFWSMNVFTACKDFERHFGSQADKKRRIFNGKLECGLYTYRGKRRPRPTQE